MDIEKLKQMGREFYKAHPKGPSDPSNDPEFLYYWKEWLRENGFSSLRLSIARGSWKIGLQEASYAASKEGRAIELLGRLFMEATHDGNNPRTWKEAGEFLQEIGWTPKKEVDAE